jgi:predicted DCC family thiol-disulfide oxidoreductase YuxK
MDQVTNRPVAFPLTIYYDASCPLCATEMHALKARDRAGRLVLVDCSRPDFSDPAAAACGVTRDHMLAFIHARDAQGQWLRGVDVFEHAYGAAGLASLARLWRNRTLRPLWDRLYPWVARHRHLLSQIGLQHLVHLLIAAFGGGKRHP